MQDPELIEEARKLLARERLAILSTLSLAHEGHPFGSILPYALNRSGAPVILISTLAVHTKNLAADNRGSLMVLEEAWREDPQAAGRLTVMGRWTPLPASDLDDVKKRYLERHPTAEQLFAMKDFSFHVMQPEHARFVAGFGRMGWLTGGELLPG